MTNSRKMASVFFMFLDMMDLSVLASVNAACTVTGTVAAKYSSTHATYSAKSPVCQLSTETEYPTERSEQGDQK